MDNVDVGLLHTVIDIKTNDTDEDTDIEEYESEIKGSNETDQNPSKRKRTCWVNPTIQKRKMVGEFATLFYTLEQDKERFKRYFNMSYEKFNELLTLVTPHIEKKNTNFRAAISPKERLAVCLRYLVTGNTFKHIAANFCLGGTTVPQIVNITCHAIWKSLGHIVMPRLTLDRWNEIEKGFSTKWNFPNCLGVLTGRKIIVSTPKYNEKTFPIMLLALIDHNSKFIIVDIGDLNKISEDGNMFSNSLLGKLLSSETLKIPDDKPLPHSDKHCPHVFIADHSIPLKRNILRAYGRSKCDNYKQKILFNNKLKHLQKTAENAFRKLIYNYQLYEKKLISKPDCVENIVLATCCLHNFLIDECENVPDDFVKSGTTLTMNNLPSARGNGKTSDALSIRDEFKNYFCDIKSENLIV